jgi:hypothetical protein
MPNQNTAPYALAKKERDNNRIVIEGLDEPKQSEAPKQSPMTGVTSSKRLLKSDTQRIDRNVLDPNDTNYSHRPGAPEAVSKI